MGNAEEILDRIYNLLIAQPNRRGQTVISIAIVFITESSIDVIVITFDVSNIHHSTFILITISIDETVLVMIVSIKIIMLSSL